MIDDFMRKMAEDLEQRAQDTNAQMIAKAECVMHNPGERPRGRYVGLLPIGNIVVLCAECYMWWQASVWDSGDAMMRFKKEYLLPEVSN